MKNFLKQAAKVIFLALPWTALILFGEYYLFNDIWKDVFVVKVKDALLMGFFILLWWDVSRFIFRPSAAVVITKV